MKKNVTLYIKLEQELSNYMDMLAQASDTIRNQNVSDYPIFVVHQNEVEIGIPIADREKIKGNWSINASSMEEFIAKQIITEEKKDSFRTIYKNPDLFICVFSLTELGAEFIFLPRKKSK